MKGTQWAIILCAAKEAGGHLISDITGRVAITQEELDWISPLGVYNFSNGIWAFGFDDDEAGVHFKLKYL